MRTGVVLGAGGYAGHAFHAGVLSALAEQTGFDGRRADVLVGTSAGSLVAAAFAAGLSAADLRAELLGRPLSPEGRALRSAARTLPPERPAEPVPERRAPLAPGALLAAARRPWGVRPGAVLSSLLPAGRASTAGIARGVNRMHGDRWPTRDLRICAVRARDARRVVFGTPGAPRVDVGTAVAASCAIPAWFAPVRLDGEAYVDGGAHSPSNADVLLRDRLDLVVISSPMSLGRGGGRPALDTGVRLVVRRYLAREVRRLRAAGTQVVVIQPTLEDLSAMGANMMDGSRAQDVLSAASDSMQARLAAQPGLRDLLAG